MGREDRSDGMRIGDGRLGWDWKKNGKEDEIDWEGRKRRREREKEEGNEEWKKRRV